MGTPCEEKIAYTSIEWAEKFAARYAKRYGGPVQRAYKCRTCQHWHLTSKDQTLHSQQIKASQARKDARNRINQQESERQHWEDRLLSKDERRASRKRID